MSKIKMMDMPLIGSRIIQRKIVRKEGGQQRSKTLREYVEKKYKVKIGMHTYGSCFVSGFNTGGCSLFWCESSYECGVNVAVFLSEKLGWR